MMAKRIMVPLEHTPTCETALPLVVDIARGAGSTVRLLNVCPIPSTVVSDSGRVIAYADQEMTRLEAAGLTYLDGIAATLQHAPIERVVRFGHPAREIQIEAESFGADLVVLTTRLHTMLRFPWSRRTAARVVRNSEVPVLLLSR